MRRYTITIEAETTNDAEVALAEVTKAISKGCYMAWWTDDDNGNGYNFDSEEIVPGPQPNIG